MNFLFFAAQYPPTVGGVERFTQSLGEQLIKCGHSVTVATSALPGLPGHEITQDGIEVFRLPARLFMNGRMPFIRKDKAFKKLAEKMWQKKYDFAVINTRFYTLSIWAAKQCKKHSTPALVLEHGTKHLSLDNPLLNFFGNIYEHTAMKLVRRSCDNFYGVSLACGQWLTHFGVKANGVLYNAVNAESLQAAAENAGQNFRKSLGIAGSAPMVVFSARFIREKGVYELLEAFAILRQKMPEAVLVMAGSGPEFATVKNAAHPNVYLCGQLQYNENLALVSQGDVYCLPSYSEGFSTSVLEAATLKAFIVTTHTGGSPELITDGKSGTLLKDLMPETIAAALQAALENPAARKNAAENAYQTLQMRFTWQATAEALISIAENV